MSKNSEAIQTIATEIKRCVDTAMQNAPYDRTVKAKVTAYLGNNKYLVMINGEEKTAISYNQLSVSDICYVTIAQNNYDDLFIGSPISNSNKTNSWELERTPLSF